MKLFLISQEHPSSDTWCDAVVVAKDEVTARLTYPSDGVKWVEGEWHLIKVNGSTTPWGYEDWAHPNDVKVEYLGEAAPHLKEGVICNRQYRGR